MNFMLVDVVVDRLASLRDATTLPLLEDAQVLRDVVDGDADLGGEVADALLAVADRVQEACRCSLASALHSSACMRKRGWRSVRSGRLLCELVNLHTCLYTPIRMDESTEAESSPN